MSGTADEGVGGGAQGVVDVVADQGAVSLVDDGLQQVADHLAIDGSCQTRTDVGQNNVDKKLLGQTPCKEKMPLHRECHKDRAGLLSW